MPKLNVTIVVPEAEQLAVTADFDAPQGIVIEGSCDRGSYTFFMPRAAAELLMLLIERALADLDDPEQQEFNS